MQALAPKLLSGHLSIENRGALDWSVQNLLAYGCQTAVVLFDAISFQHIQTLDEHDAKVCCVRWCPVVSSRSSAKSHDILLASGDVNGAIHIWNSSSAKTVCSFRDTADGSNNSRRSDGKVLDLQWLPDEPSCLISIHAPNVIHLWDVATNTKRWRVVYEENVAALCFDPFDSTRIALVSVKGSVHVFQDLSSIFQPSAATAPKKVRIESHRSAHHVRSAANRLSDANEDGFLLQLTFSTSTRHLLYCLLPRELFVFDLSIYQPIGSIGLDRTYSSFSKFLVTSEASQLFFCLHDDHFLSIWRKKPIKHSSRATLSFDLLSSTELMAASKLYAMPNLLGFANAPFDETKICGVTGDGRLWLWQYLPTANSAGNPGAESHQMALQNLCPSLSFTVTVLSVRPSMRDRNLTRAPSSDRSGRSNSSTASPFPSSPEGSHPADDIYLAAGSVKGTVTILDLRSSAVLGEFSIWDCAVTGLAWCGLHTLVVLASEKKLSNSLYGTEIYRNRVVLLNTRNGSVRTLRADQKNTEDDGPLVEMKVSNKFQYLALVFKNRPFEIWHLPSRSLVLSAEPLPTVKALDWMVPNASDRMEVPFDPSMDPTAPQVAFKEELTVVTEGNVQTITLHHKSIVTRTLTTFEGLPASMVSAVSVKHNLATLGDTQGTLNWVDMRTKTFRQSATNRGPISRLRFSAQDRSYQLLVLFQSGEFALWDAEQKVELSWSSQVRPLFKAIDIAWAGEWFQYHE
eukprot:GILK01009656.1.p1 GENE.GILK01009656.1~~GILK01009656.1.p1  ORF type:complete len:787 (-),score=111.96 GILK01009656.1:2044-4269(-)